ncbi:disease resistance protein RGA5-like isoform X2 [Triticum urartu]|uniref:disease resistance protein RGA5-like isoform X2 n=1 Tax=Triticum urartu TaxID=4572 RepID=UPI002042CE29|nr:disease resistance protein RGA5-like isoform X2 [Triticum urartu]
MELSPVSSSLGAMGSLSRKLDELLATGHWALRGAAMDGIGHLAADLHELQSLLLSLSNAQDPPVAAGCWMKEVRELSYDVEDCADRFVNAAETRRRPARRNASVARLKINRLPRRRRWLPWINSRVLEFRTRAQEASERYWRYQFDDCASGPEYSPATGRTVCAEPGDHVGMEGPVGELHRSLTDGQEQLKVVAIVGVAGIGKTTLALKLLGKLQGQFECVAFARTAQKPNMRGIISSILSQVRPHQLPDPADMHHLIRDLKEHLQDKRYFIVIDDLWATSVWDVLSRAFPEGSSCSRIVATTEIMEVAQACCSFHPVHIFQMEFLSDNDSQKLLLQRILSENQSPQHFDHVLPHILRKCGGLPLAIIMVASLLASRPEKLDQLGFVQSSLGSNMRLQAHPTMERFMEQLLNIRFDSLPHYLKTCLLYLSTCPEGYIFLKDDLVKQWLAEDLICAQLGKDMEEVAISYFDELVSMGLIQVMDINYSYDLLSYSVHHMVLDFITYKSIEENFITVVDYSQTAMLLPDKVRRLSLHFGSATYATTPASTRLSQVRSLFFFGLFNCMPSLMVFKFLRVLNLRLWVDLGNMSLDLTRISELFRLRYLHVTCSAIVKLPDQIEAMKHLETLEINSRVCAIPPDIVRLPSLLHLCLRGGTNLPDGIGHIRSLRTLKYFDLGNNSEDNLWSLGELTNLRDLHFTYSRLPSSEHLKRNLIALASSLGKLCNLKSVTLAPGTAGMVVLVDGSSSMSSAPVFLERLELLPPICIFSRLPKWIGQLRKIRIVKVAVKELLTNDIDILTGLPSLAVLSLWVQTAPEGGIIFNEGALPVLKYFEFRCGVLCLAFMAGAMPNLRRIKLAFNTDIREKYSNMLAGIEHLLNLQDVTGQIGVVTESDRGAAESAFKEAISKHPMSSRSSIQWVDPVEKVFCPSEKQYLRRGRGSSDETHGGLEKAEDAIKHAKRGKTSSAGLDLDHDIKAYRTSCSSAFFPQKRVRTHFFCIRRKATKMGQSYTTTKGGTDRTENKKEQQKLQTPLNYVQRKNQQQSSHSSASVGNKTEDAKLFSTTPSSSNLQSIEREEQMLLDSMEQECLDSSQPGEQIAAETVVQSQVSSPSSRSPSSARHHEEEHASGLNLAGEGMKMSSNIILKQDILAKVKEHEEQIASLRMHLVDYSVKESHILNEKLVLEKRIAYMRREFDQHQQDSLDAASKALSYRQDIIEENLHLAYSLQAARRSRSNFVLSLTPLLSAHNLQPSIPDAQSIVSNLKVLFTHLQEKLAITEEKQKELQYQIARRAESSNITAQTPSHPPGNALSQTDLDIVPQQAYPHVQRPISYPVRARRDRGLLANENRQILPTKAALTDTEHDNVGRTSPPRSNQFTKYGVAKETERDSRAGRSRAVRFNFESKDQNPSFKAPVGGDVTKNLEGAETQTSREPPAEWSPQGPPNLVSGLEGGNLSYPYLPTVLEEPSSSFFEAAEDDPLPAIDGLRITGEAFPGSELQASGYSSNGTTSCYFEWVRHLEDGSVNYIEGAKQPTYLVTADDLDSLLAIEVQPLDDRKRKGEIVKVYANEQRKITCDPEMKELIEKILSIGHVSYEVLLPVKFINMWDPALLAINREGYSIKCNGQRGVVMTEKFQQATTINIPYGRPTEFSIQSAKGAEYNLKPAKSSPSRDAIVLILRLYRMKVRAFSLFLVRHFVSSRALICVCYAESGSLEHVFTGFIYVYFLYPKISVVDLVQSLMEGVVWSTKLVFAVLWYMMEMWD